MRGVVGAKVVVKGGVPAEDAGVFGVEAEDEADAENVETAERARIGGVAVLGEKFVVEEPDELSRLDGDFELAAGVFVAFVHEEVEAVVFFLEIFETDDFGLGVGALEVVNVEFGEVADDDPARARGVRQLGGVTLRLLKRSQQRTVGLARRLAEILVGAFLLDEDFGRGNGGVDEARVRELDAVFEGDEFFGFGDAEDVAEKREPEGLGFALFVALVAPELGERLGGGAAGGVGQIFITGGGVCRQSYP